MQRRMYWQQNSMVQWSWKFMLLSKVPTRLCSTAIANSCGECKNTQDSSIQVLRGHSVITASDECPRTSGLSILVAIHLQSISTGSVSGQLVCTTRRLDSAD
jgi:hypothetical protein